MKLFLFSFFYNQDLWEVNWNPEPDFPEQVMESVFQRSISCEQMEICKKKKIFKHISVNVPKSMTPIQSQC